MFPPKIKLTEEYIDLIVKKRKENRLTAYELSEKLGKNKSWIPNIENHRTKNIASEDFLLIFEDFAKKENLSTENYIIKYLHPNAIVELKDGTTVPCNYLQTKLELLSLNNSPEEYLDSYDFYHNEIPYQNDLALLKLHLTDLNELLLEEFELMTKDERLDMLNLVDTMKDNFTYHFKGTQSIYSVNIFKNAPVLIEGSALEKQLYENILRIKKHYVSSIALGNARARVYTFLDSSSYDYIPSQIIDAENFTPTELSTLLFSIEKYMHAIWYYINLYFNSNPLGNNEPKINYHKLYSMLVRFLKSFVTITNLSYTFEYEIPTNDISIDDIHKKHLEISSIAFEIKQKFHNKYNC